MLALSLLGGCAALTPANDNLEVARSDFRAAQTSEDVFLLAGPEMDDASEAMHEADVAWRRHADRRLVDSLALVVTRCVATARLAATRRKLELRLRASEVEAQ